MPGRSFKSNKTLSRETKLIGFFPTTLAIIELIFFCAADVPPSAYAASI